MKKRKLKPAVKLTGFIIILIICFLLTYLLLPDKSAELVKSDNGYIYVNDYIFDDYYPVINQDEKIIKPYENEKVSIYKNFYEKDSTEEEQKNSIILYDGIYMQNSGVDYKSEETFDINSILPGTVTNITEDKLLGKTVEVRYSTEIIVMYQSLGEITIKKGDIITQGQVIAKSGTCELNKENKNNLHIEIYKNGVVVNPEKLYNKSIKELSEN